MLRTYPEAVDYLLQTYSTDAIKAETDATLTRYIESSNMLSTQYAI